MRTLETSQRYIPRLACRRGSISIFVLLFIIVALLFFQSYIHFETSDYGVGWDLDNAGQRNIEAENLAIITKEALLTYYERGYFQESGGGRVVRDLILDQLTYLNSNSDILYSLAAFPGALPSNGRDSFWRMNPGTFSDISGKHFEHINDFIPMESAYDAGGDYTFQFTRQVGSVSDTVTVQAHLWQVPVTDFNVNAYVQPIENGIPETENLPDIVGLGDGDIRGLALSQINNIAGGPKTFPYYYRELFSAGAQVWQYVFYSSGYYAEFLKKCRPLTHDLNRMRGYGPEDATKDGLSYEADGAGGMAWHVDLKDLEQNLNIKLSTDPTQKLYLEDSGSKSTDTPLFLYIMNRGNSSPVEVHLASKKFARPLMIVGENVHVVLDSNVTLNGALFIDTYSDTGDAIADNGCKLSINGSFAWNAKQSVPSDLDVDVYSKSDMDNPFRSVAPRFLLVETSYTVSRNK